MRCWCTYLVGHSVTVPGFKTFCVDRDINLSGQKKRGGIDMLPKKESFCGLDSELLAVGMHP